MFVTHLECSNCSTQYPAGQLHALCTKCQKPLLVRYDLNAVSQRLTKEHLAGRPSSMWRYREVLPLKDDAHLVSLGEGMTPLVHSPRLGKEIGVPNLYIKDESLNPTASFKARGLGMAVTMAKELGVKKLAIPSAGNAAGALATYAARAGMEAHIFVPKDVPAANLIECQAAGANVTLIDGVITDCGKEVARRKDAEGWFDVSTLKEPYRIEGKKTLGYELAEQLGWKLPDVILYPTGGGTGLIGMWKAFDEMECMGWIGSARPRMVTVQAEGCAPIVRAFEAGARDAAEISNPFTVASGLRVPRAIGDFIMLDILRKSGGTAVAVSDDSLVEAVGEIDRLEGVFCAPEGAACLPALRKLLASGWVQSSETVVMFNTGSALKYLDVLQSSDAKKGAAN